MAAISQSFKIGEEYTFEITQLPELNTDSFDIYSIEDTMHYLTARKITNTTFGLTCNTSPGNTFTSNLQIKVNGVYGYDSWTNNTNGLAIDVTINGTVQKEPVRIYNPSNTTVEIGIYRTRGSAPTLDIYYCVGSTEGEYIHFTDSTTYGTTPSITFTLQPNHSVWFYSESMTHWANAGTADYINIRNTTSYTLSSGLEMSGSTASLITGNITGNCFYRLFSDFSALGSVSSSFLPATNIAATCYAYMFAWCKSLTNAPNLPALTLPNECYASMFYQCSSLTTAPELPATTLSNYCYYQMFRYCTSLTTAPNLPALIATTSCYNGMFANCTALTSAPESLPATTLDISCYSGMFAQCTSLQRAPSLPALTLVLNCYQGMFNGCGQLNYVRALFTTEPSRSYTMNWLYGVAATGTFVKNPNATWDVSGANGVPSGWTVITNTNS